MHHRTFQRQTENCHYINTYYFHHRLGFLVTQDEEGIYFHRPCRHQPTSRMSLFKLTGTILETSNDRQELCPIEVAHLHKHIIILDKSLPHTETTLPHSYPYKWRDLPRSI